MAILEIDQTFFKHVRWAALDLQHASPSSQFDNFDHVRQAMGRCYSGLCHSSCTPFRATKNTALGVEADQALRVFARIVIRIAARRPSLQALEGSAAALFPGT
jgi:hypothetical protein